MSCTVASEKWFRVEEISYASALDEYDNPIGTSRLELRVRQFDVKKVTPKGVWLDLGWGDARFVRTNARKQYACPTLELAMESFKARKQRQIKLLTSQLRRAERALALGIAQAGAIPNLPCSRGKPRPSPVGVAREGQGRGWIAPLAQNPCR